jgi:hypothetical protein
MEASGQPGGIGEDSVGLGRTISGTSMRWKHLTPCGTHGRLAAKTYLLMIST